MTDIKALRLSTGMKQGEIAKYFDIPLRTLQNWEAGVRQPPEYLIALMQYKLEKEGLI